MASRQRNENGAISMLLARNFFLFIVVIHCLIQSQQKPQNMYIFVTKKQRPEQEQGCVQRSEICFF
jgi:hypothetical protein